MESGISKAFPTITPSIDFLRKTTPKKDLREILERPLPLQPLYPDLPPKTVKPNLQSHIPYAASIAYSQRSHTDKSFFMGRSFRVGWGPNGTLVHSGFALGKVSFLCYEL
jgi:hypothetical protein